MVRNVVPRSLSAFFVQRVQKRNFPFLFAPFDRNLLRQITYVTLASLYLTDISNYPGMTVAKAIMASFEDTEKLYSLAKTSKFVYFRARREKSYFRCPVDTGCYNHWKLPRESSFVLRITSTSLESFLDFSRTISPPCVELLSASTRKLETCSNF